MGTTADKLQRALDNKNAIKNVINHNGGNVDDVFSTYAPVLDELLKKSGGKIEGVDTSNNQITIEETAQFESVTIQKPNTYIDVNGLGSTISINNGVTITYENGSVEAENLTAENIKKDISILGVTGSYEGNGGSGSTLKTLLDTTKNARHLFYSYQGDNLGDLIQYSDTENVIDFTEMCRYCSKATIFPRIDTSNGQNFGGMFWEASNFIDIAPLNTIKGIYFNQMFYYISKIKKIDISYFYSSSTSNSYRMSYGCYSLKAFIIRSFGENYVLDSQAFSNCYHILGTVNSTYNPNGDKDGYIYVPRAMISVLSETTNWSTLSSQFRALEDYTIDGTTTGIFDEGKAGI